MEKYLHGSYGVMGETIARRADVVAGLPVYVGVAPVHLLPKADWQVDRPIRCANWRDGVAKCGYSEDWEKFSLCEALDAHFNNAIQNIGPVCLINVLDPETMRASAQTQAQLPFAGGRGEIRDDLCIVDSIEIASKQVGVDYTAAWNEAKQAIEIRDLTGAMTGPVEVTYTRVDVSQVTEAAIIGTRDEEEGVYTGLRALPLVYQQGGIVPTMLAAPGWSDKPAVRLAMIAEAYQVDDHWFVHVLTDIPVSAATITEAKEWKQTHGYDSASEVAHWPMARKGDKLYHGSTLSVVAAMMKDAANGGVPKESPSNTELDITGYYIAADKQTNFTTRQANLLNAEGIRTFAFFGGRWALWGPHTAAFQHEGGASARDTYDNHIRMLYYIANQFEVTYGAEVDRAVSRSRIEAIVSEVRADLDALRADESLFAGDVQYEELESVGDLVKAQFTFGAGVTPIPPMRALTLRVAYDENGLEQF